MRHFFGFQLEKSLPGQTALEYLMITSFLLVMSGIIFAYATTNYQQAADLGLVKGTVAGIVNAADQVYALGEGSVIFIEVETPANITDIMVEYACKDLFDGVNDTIYGAAYPGCTHMDPDIGCCGDAAGSVCTEWEPDGYALPEGCLNYFSSDRAEYSVKRSYVTFSVQQMFGVANVYRDSPGSLSITPDAKGQLKSPGKHVLKVWWADDTAADSEGQIVVDLWAG